MRRAAAVVLVSLLARAGAPPVEGETPEEAEARKARERKEVEVDMLAMHHWFCDQPANADMYLCDAFRDYLAGTPESEMAKKRPHPNPASEQISTMHETYCAIEDNVQRQPCRFFKPRRKRDL